METIEPMILLAHVLVAIAIVGLVLLQRGKGAEMGSGFGAGSSGTVFGSRGATSFLTKVTTGLAIAFFLSSFGLAYYAKERSEVAGNLGVPQVQDLAPDDLDSGQELPALEAAAEEGELPAFDEPAETEEPAGGGP